MDDVETKPLPLTVSVAPPSMVVTEVGERLVICGAGLLMVNVPAFELPPPGAGLFTTICPEPPSARSAAVRATCNCVELANVVTRSLWFHCAFEVGTKPVPVTVTLRPARPAVTVFCESEEITGAGLFTGNAAAVEVPPPG